MRFYVISRVLYLNWSKAKKKNNLPFALPARFKLLLSVDENRFVCFFLFAAPMQRRSPPTTKTAAGRCWKSSDSGGMFVASRRIFVVVVVAVICINKIFGIIFCRNDDVPASTQSTVHFDVSSCLLDTVGIFCFIHSFHARHFIFVCCFLFMIFSKISSLRLWS